MKRLAAFGFGLAALALAPSAVRAESTFSDTTCVQATAPVRAYFDKTKDPSTTLEDAVAYAQKVVDAYDQCAAEKRERGEIETLQYAHLSAARYDYVIGGWQHLGGNDGLARTALQAAVKLAQDIIDWHPDSQLWYASNDVNIGSGSWHNSYANGVSKYHQEAIEVRDAALKSIGLLDKPAAPAPAPTGK
jgi:hypothetical protein